MIDADKGSTDDRHRQLARSLSDANVQARNANEPIVVLVPKRHVETATQAVWKGRRLLTPVGGGVIVRPRNALKTSNLLSDEDGRVAAAHEGVDLSKLPKDKWWWDAK